MSLIFDSIFMVLTYWLSSRRLQVDQQLLWQMKNFCEAAMHKKTSTLMLDKIGDLLHLIDERVHLLSLLYMQSSYRDLCSQRWTRITPR